MKFAVFTVMLPDLTPEEAAAELKASGYDGVEWRFTTIPEERRNEAPSFWGNNYCTFAPTMEDARRARQIADANGLKVPSLGTYLTVGDLKAVENAMQIAQICGSPAVRVGSPSMTPNARYSQLFSQARAYLEGVQALSKQYGILGLVEMHHRTISASATLARRLLEGLNPACIGVIHDAGNMVYEGFEDYRIGLEVLGPYLKHVHLKNALYRSPENGSNVWQATWAPIDNGVVDFAALFGALREIGYDGWMSFEDFSNARPSREALRHNLAYIQDIWAAV